MIIIQHSIPNHRCFAIIQPAVGNGFTQRCYLINGKSGDHYVLIQKDKSTVDCTLLSYWEFELTQIPEALCYLVYGNSLEKVVQAMIAKYPILKTNPNVEILLLRKT